MKKRIVSMMLALAACSMLAACGAEGGAPASTTQSTEAEEKAEEKVEEKVEEKAEDAKEEEKKDADDKDEAKDDDADGDVAGIKEKGKLIVGITDFAPMDYKDDSGNWIGFDADMAREIATALGVEAEFVEIDWDNKILELENGSIDVVWNGMTLTPEVTNAMECTNPYCNNAQVVVVKADAADKYKDKDSLKDLTFAVESGSAGEAAATENGFNTVAVKSQADAVMEVEAGTSDACIIDLLMAGAMVGEGTGYEDLTHTVELTTEEYGIGCRKGSDLAAFINDELKSLYSDGKMTEIAKKYGVQDAVVAQ